MVQFIVTCDVAEPTYDYCRPSHRPYIAIDLFPPVHRNGKFRYQHYCFMSPKRGHFLKAASIIFSGGIVKEVS